MLRWLKTVVVSDVEKAHVMRQVGIGKTVPSPRFRGSLLTCRNSVGDIKTGWHHQEGRGLLATHHPPVPPALRPLGMGARFLVVRMTRAR
jgi:hypothetical protein